MEKFERRVGQTPHGLLPDRVGHDRETLDKFIAAYELESLPILISEGRSVGQMLKVNIVPQYLLIEKGGKVLHRWDGVQHNKQPLFANGNTN